MPGSVDKSGETDKSGYWRWVVGFFVLPALLVVALVGLITTHQAAQSELAGAKFGPNAAPAQIGQPAGETPTFRAN
jgi:hypothetical protein